VYFSLGIDFRKISQICHLCFRVYNQRFQFKKKGEGDDVPLNDERIEKLNAIGFCWKAKSNDEWRESDRDRRREKSQDGWDDKYAKLVTFQKRKGE
jgi:hypothetical protein